MSTSSIFMGPPVAASTPAAKHASLLEPSDSDRGKRTLKRKGPMLSPIHGGSWRKPAKRKASTSDTNGHG